MKGEPRFLSEHQIRAIHRNVINAFGGDSSLRDHRLLSSAIAMPAATFSGQLLHTDMPTMAAAYLFHLCKNHPFVDGNKRTALAAAEIFLIVNDWKLKATDEELGDLTVGVADGTVSKDEVIEFFRNHAVGI
jgi:death-on-curing protein